MTENLKLKSFSFNFSEENRFSRTLMNSKKEQTLKLLNVKGKVRCHLQLKLTTVYLLQVGTSSIVTQTVMGDCVLIPKVFKDTSSSQFDIN